MSLSRRQFLAGVGAAGVAAAGASLVGCSPSNTSGGSGTGDVGGAGGSANGDLIAAASLNPQDYSYRDATDVELTTLFSPLKLGSIDLSHRMVKSAAGSATYLAGPSEEIFEYYVNFAKGGIEFIWVESVAWLGPQLVPPRPGAVEVSKEDGFAFGQRLAEECAKYGCSLGVQWGAFASSPIGELTKEDIVAQEELGAATAKWYQDMGFKALEIHVTGGGLANSLLSRFTNTRTDEYGIGSLENRARFVTETIQKIKAACGDDFVIEAMIECVAENDNVTNNVGEAFLWKDRDITLAHNKVSTIEEQIEMAKLFEAAGLDCLQCRIGVVSYHPAQFASDLYFILNGIEGNNAYGIQWDFSRHFQGQMIGNTSGAGMLLDIAKRYKDNLSIPVGTVTYMDPAHAPGFFEQALADGKADYLLMTRPLTVDTEYVNKLREGRLDEIAPCCRCLHCHSGSNESNREDCYCRVNSMTQRVMSGKPGTPDSYELPPLSGDPKKVMVIGGGPGGMEAARIAAARGHEVTLYDANGALGDKMDFCSRIKGPHQNIEAFKNYLIRQQEVNGVDVVLNTEVDAALIESEAPDAVVLAVGGLYEEAGFDGSDTVQIVDFANFESAEIGDDVVIYGSNAQAWDCALWMTVRKKRVHLVTPKANEELDIQQSQHEMRMMTTALYSLGMKAWPGSDITGIGEGTVTISTDQGVDIDLPADAVIVGCELTPNTSLLDGISVPEVYSIGDCDTPYNIAKAVIAGNDAGRTV